MEENCLTQLQALQLHLDCLFTDENGRMAFVNEPWGSVSPAPLLFVGQTLQGEILWRFGRRASAAFIEAAEGLLRRGEKKLPAYQKALFAGRCSQENCFYFSGRASLEPGCRLLGEDDLPLLLAAFPDCGEELAAAQPYTGAFCGGELVCICRSVRKGRAHESGIETLPAFRRRGYALTALKSWTAAVLAQGAVPLYSALLQNTASLQLAQKAGYQPYAQGFQIWESGL